MRKTIIVTQDDMSRSPYLYNGSCAIERAVNRNVKGLSGVRARYNNEYNGQLWLFTKKGHCQIINLPDEATKLMRGYDQIQGYQQYLKPLEFTVELDERISAQIKECENEINP